MDVIIKDMTIDDFGTLDYDDNNHLIGTGRVDEAEEFAPMRHAYWKKIGVLLYECSNCQKVAPYYTEGTHVVYWSALNYCPNCGAKMDGNENESC